MFFSTTETVLGGAGSGNGGRYRKFQDLCITSFLTLRKHANLLLALFSIMVDCGIPDLRSLTDLEWIHEALMLDVSDDVASQRFLDLIHESLRCHATRVNHAIHVRLNPMMLFVTSAYYSPSLQFLFLCTVFSY